MSTERYDSGDAFMIMHANLSSHPSPTAFFQSSGQESHTALENPYSFTLIDVVASGCLLRSIIPSGVMMPIYVSTGWGYFLPGTLFEVLFIEVVGIPYLFYSGSLYSLLLHPFRIYCFILHIKSSFHVGVYYTHTIILLYLYERKKTSKSAILYNCKFTSLFKYFCLVQFSFMKQPCTQG